MGFAGRQSKHTQCGLFAIGVFVAAAVVFLAPPARASATATSSLKTMAAMKTMGTTKTTRAAPSVADGTAMAKQYQYLAKQHSNTCMLDPSSLAKMNPNARLQGACCGPMTAKLYPEYVQQLDALAKLNHFFAPSNPYNMPVRLAQRLVGFNDQILLTPAQQQIYDRAFPLARDHAPCCCHCWRWTAFEGQAKYLIAYRRYTSKQIANLWGLDDGCGDTSGPAGMGGMGG